MALTNVHWGRIGFAGCFGMGAVLLIGGLLLGGEIEYLIDKGKLQALESAAHEKEAQLLRDKETEQSLHQRLGLAEDQLEGQVWQVQEQKKKLKREKEKVEELHSMAESIQSQTHYLSGNPPPPHETTAQTTVRDGAAIKSKPNGSSPAPPPPPPSCCDVGCRTCAAGGAEDGGQPLHNSVCFDFCSVSKFCGLGDSYSRQGSMDCRSCALLSAAELAGITMPCAKESTVPSAVPELQALAASLRIQHAVRIPPRNLTGIPPPPVPPPPPCCDSGCRTCPTGGGSVCLEFCSFYNFCGTGDDYDYIDCRGCALLSAAERQAEAPCLDGALPATVPELQEVVASLRRQHTAARMPPEIWHSRAPWSTYLYGEGKPAEAAVADGPVLDTTVVAKRQWAVILPFHGAAGSHRLAVVNATWLSMCRAMRAADEHHAFHVLAVDDSHIESFNDAELRRWHSDWTDRCSAPNLLTLTRVTGLKSIAKNIKMGFEWAASGGDAVKDGVALPFDYVTNIDSDLLLTESFFSSLAKDYHVALGRCPYSAVSGYTSNIHDGAYGANYMFGQPAYVGFIEHSMGSRAWDYAWDEQFNKLHSGKCHGVPTRPVRSYAHHMASTEGIHYDWNGDKEMGLGFQWDEFSMRLREEAFPHHGKRFYGLAKADGKPTTDIGCFDGPFSGKRLLHCAGDAAAAQSAKYCFSYGSLAHAQHACLRLESCSGVVQKQDAEHYTLRSGTDLHDSTVPTKSETFQDEELTSTKAWTRKAYVDVTRQNGEAQRHACIVDPTDIKGFEKESQAAMLSVYKGMRPGNVVPVG